MFLVPPRVAAAAITASEKDLKLTDQLLIAVGAAQAITGIVVGLWMIVIYTRMRVVMENQTALMSRQTSDSNAIQRAYINYSHPSILTSMMHQERKFIFNVAVTLTNSGNTDAKNVSFWRNQGCFSRLPEGFEFPRGPKSSSNSDGATVAPKTEFLSHHITIPDRELKQVIEGTHKYYIWGTCEYDDIFSGSPRHWRNFCIEGQPGVDVLTRAFGEAVVIIQAHEKQGRVLELMVFRIYGEGNESGSHPELPHGGQSRRTQA